jgi:hypothetical protein
MYAEANWEEGATRAIGLFESLDYRSDGAFELKNNSANVN